MEWAKKDGLVIAVQHEPLHFIRRAGYAGAETELQWNRLHTEETVKNLAKNNCKFIRMHFFKGSGYKFETEERLLVKQFSKWCHKYDVKLQLYIQFGTISADTYPAEEPDFLDWVQKDRFGDPIRLEYTPPQLYRYYPCLNSPGYWNYLEKVVEDGILNYGADAIGFDNINTGECMCENCRKAFVTYLKAKYKPDTPEGRKLSIERFGHAILDHFLPPYWSFDVNPSDLEDIRNPSIQEWIWFRNDSTRRVIERMYNLCKKLNPNILVEINAYKGSGINTSLCDGLYLPDLVNGMDAFWDEIDPQPDYKDGVLYHRIRAYKTARAMDKVVFTSQRVRDIGKNGVPYRYARLGFAESMAFHYGYISGVDNALPIADGKCSFGEYKLFEMDHKELYQAKPCSKFAIYESMHSFSLSNFDYHYANVIMTQALLRGKLPYSLVLNLDNLDKQPAIILAGCACLSAEEMDKLSGYVKNGGSLIMTGRTGTRDHWNRSWGDKGTLRARLGLWAPEDGVYSGLLRYTVGRGKVLDIPCFETQKTFADCEFPNFSVMQVPRDCWTAPENLPSLLDALCWASPCEMMVKGPESLICELAEDNRYIYLHLINYDYSKALSNIGVSLKKRYTVATQLFPLSNSEKPLIIKDNVVKVDMDDVYTIIRYKK